ncbi:MAG: sodium:proton antiporter [Thermoplasmataceae archaeon]|jgi:NhaP-type Na+/H+ or K+/H+ antiporter|nr:sodium:proton antiporter [Candidatus Thermoplasmatota archaeon]
MIIENLRILEFSLLLIIAAFSIPIARKASIVEIPVLIFLGIIFGPVLGIIRYSFSEELMTSFANFGIGILGLMIILYYESHGINFRVLRRHLGRIISLNTVGMIITAFLSGILFSLFTGAPFIIGFLFGAIISPTDPATLIPLFHKIRIREDYSGTLIGESLFNDPLAIIFVTLAIAIIAPQSTAVTLFLYLSGAIGFIPAIITFLLIQIIIPSIVGIVIGLLILYLNKILNFENLIVGLLLGVIIFELTFLEALNITPFPAIIATGAIIGNLSEKSIFYERERSFQENLSFLAQGVIFILMGSMLTIPDIENYWIIGILMALVVLFLVRPIAVFASVFRIRKNNLSAPPLNRKIKTFFSLAGPRGVVSIVESTVPIAIGTTLGIPLLLRWGRTIEVSVAIVVILSIILQTLYIPYIANKLLPKTADEKT